MGQWSLSSSLQKYSGQQETTIIKILLLA